MAGLADIIAGVVGGLGQTGVAIAAKNDAKRERLYQQEQQSTLDKMFAKQEVQLANKNQLTQMASSLLQQAQAGQVAQKQAAASNTAKIILYTVGGLVIIGITATLIIYKRRSARAV